jgi:two-component system phosphate regulon sensor histidine kinase PhoR
VRRRFEFFRELRWVLLGLALALLVGVWLGEPAAAIACASSVVLVVWGVQLHRVHRWLNDPEGDPPEGSGIWGLLFDNIYLLQRRNKEAQGRLASSLEYLQDSLASMQDAWLIIDSRGAIAWANASASHLVGVQFPADRGQPILNLVRIPAFATYFSEGDFTAPLRLPPGQEGERCLQIEVSVFGDGDRLVFVRDITEQYRLESMRQDFVGNVSHELRTPLTVIKGYIDTLLDVTPASDTAANRAMRQMSEQVVRMERLLRDLLWLSTIESVEGLRKTESVDFPGLLREIVGELRTAYSQREINLQLNATEGLMGDTRELRSAVSNLVINALKYSDDGTAVDVSWTRTARGWELGVTDQGVGIDATHIPRLTERFYRVDRSRSQRTGGTGLGLAIVKHVAVSHQAELDIRSEFGEGSTFSLIFPYGQVVDAAA